MPRRTSVIDVITSMKKLQPRVRGRRICRVRARAFFMRPNDSMSATSVAMPATSVLPPPPSKATTPAAAMTAERLVADEAASLRRSKA